MPGTTKLRLCGKVLPMSGRPLTHIAVEDLAAEDRRAVPRTSVACPVRLVTVAGHQDGEMRDLSLVGAQVCVPVLPAKDTTVILRWQDHERVCIVIWAKDGLCGLRFDRPLSGEIVGLTLAPAEVRPGARLNQIQPGSRRTSFLRRAQD